MKIPTKFPTWMGILLVVALVTTIIVVSEKAFRTSSQASESEKPGNIRITNIADATFTVTWTTQLPSTGTLSILSGINKQTVHYDERDKTGKLGKFRSHSVIVRNASAATNYSFKLLSNGRAYLDNGKPYYARTASQLPINDGVLDPAYGSIKTSSDTPADDTLVYITIEGGQDLSSITKPSGTWIIPLNQTRTADLTAYLPTVERMNEQLVVKSGDQTTTAVTDTLNDSPVPDMNLGKQYDFRRQQAKTSNSTALALRPVPDKTHPSTTTVSKIPVTIGTVLGENTAQTHAVTITSPKNNSAIPSTLPLIQGTGVPGKYIGISIGFSNVIHGSVKVSQNGIWSYTPTRQLSPGNQTVTISSVDSLGKAIAITHAFQILKSGTQVLGDATPSATLTPFITNTPFITPTISPTGMEFVTPTETPFSTLSGSAPPTTGYSFPTLLLLVIGMGMLAGGSVVMLRN